MKRILPVAVFVLSALLSGCIRETGDESEGANISVGDKLPALSLKMADGSTRNSEQLKGKVSVIILFTTTCPDCRDQLPAIDELYRTYNGDERVIIFGISRSEENESISQYWEKEKLILPYSPQKDRAVYNLFATSIVPRIYISDETMTVRRIYTDSRPLVTSGELKNAVEALLD